MIDALRNMLDDWTANVIVERVWYAWALLKPEPKQSTRFSKKRAYTDDRKKTYVEALADDFETTLLHRPPAGPVRVRVLYCFPWRTTDRHVALDWAFMLKRPDVDNLTKPVLDALSDCGFLADDNTVAEVQARKIRFDLPCVALRADLLRKVP